MSKDKNNTLKPYKVKNGECLTLEEYRKTKYEVSRVRATETGVQSHFFLWFPT